MKRFACIIVVLVAGCSFDEAALRAPALDAGSNPPLRGPAVFDAGTAPDLRTAPDTVAIADLKPQTVDTLTVPDTRCALDSLPASCMQQVVANGYASDKASCATWDLKFTEPYNSKLAVPWTSQSACKFIIDCFAAKPDVYTSWAKQPNCDCTCPIPLSAPDWQPLIDIVSPFCPTFFTP